MGQSAQADRNEHDRCRFCPRRPCTPATADDPIGLRGRGFPALLDFGEFKEGEKSTR